MSNKLLFRLFALVAAMMCALGASAAEAYACYTSSNKTLTFYYDNQRSTRPGTTYDLNTGNSDPGWRIDNTCLSVSKVVFDSSFAGARPTSTYRWFSKMSKLTSITGISYLNTANVTNMTSMFYNCSKLTSLDLSSFNTANVTNMDYMFYDCLLLTILDVSSFNTANVTNMRSMFYNCSKLTSLDLSNFNTANVTDMVEMFYNCQGLTCIFAGSYWKTSKVTSSTDMFLKCYRIQGGMGTTYSTSNPMDKTYARIDGGPSNPGYLSNYLEAYACYTPDNTTLTFYYDDMRASRPGTTYSMNTGDNSPGWVLDDAHESITTVVFSPSFADARPTSTHFWFYMENLQSIDNMRYYLNTSEVTNMSYMFYGCGLTDIDLRFFNTSKVTTMRNMFSFSLFTSLDLSCFNTANVTDMTQMFEFCYGLESIDLNNFNTSKVTSMFDMFESCMSLTSLNLSGFNTSKVTDMEYMFRDCSELTTIYVGSRWTTAAVTSSSNMFKGCTKIKGQQGTTYNSSHVDKAYAHIDGGTANPGYLSEPPIEAYACYTSDNTTLTFYYDNSRSIRAGMTYSLPTGGNFPNWIMLGYESSVTQVVFDASFAEARPTSTRSWFAGMKHLTTLTGMQYFNSSLVTDMAWMFDDCSSLTNLDLSHFNTANVTDMSGMFSDCGLTSLDVSSFNTAKVTDMSFMFRCCYRLTSLDLSNFNTSKVTSMDRMFLYCDGLTSIDLSSFKTEQLEDMTWMFSDCTSLNSIDLSSFNTANVTSMGGLFDECCNLRTIYVGNGWSTEEVVYSWDMFYNCQSLVGGMGTTYDVNHVDKAYAHIDGGTDNPGYFTEKVNYLRGDVNGDSSVTISDVTALIDYLLSGDASAINTDAADCNQDNGVSIADVTALIDYLLSGSWN